MTDVTQILSEIVRGDPAAAERLLSLVYDELRQLAVAKIANEKPGQTLQATALVHEAYLRLVDGEKLQDWNSRGHFFMSAAEAMRRILVEHARRKQQVGRGGDQRRIPRNVGQLSRANSHGMRSFVVRWKCYSFTSILGYACQMS